jgi:PAS domain S-box-containing protein
MNDIADVEHGALSDATVATSEPLRQLAALRRIALAVARPSPPSTQAMLHELLAELAEALPAMLLMVAVFADDTHEKGTHLRTLAARLHGEAVPDFEYAVQSSPCRKVVGAQFRYMAEGVRAEIDPAAPLARLGLDAYAAFPLNDSRGAPLGVLAALDRTPIAGGDAAHAEVMLKVVAVRAGAEIERLRALEALRRSEASYRAIFDSAASAIYVHDWDTFALIDANQRACDDHGRTREEVLSAHPSELMGGEAPCDLPHALEKLQLAKLGRCPPFEWQVRPQGGALRWWEIHLKPAQLDGRACILAFTHDITARKLAEQQVRASEEQHRTIFNASVDGMLVKDADNLVVDVNEAYLRMHGFAREELIGHCLLDYLPEQLRARCTELLPRVLSGTPCHFEAQTWRRDGRLLDVEIHGVPVVYGGQTRALVIMRDITARMEADARLRASEAQYRAIFNASADALILWDREYRRVDVNAAYERLYGWKREEVVGRGFEVYSGAPGHVEPRRELVRRALAGESCRAELEGIDRAGRRIVTEIHTVPFQHRGEPHVLAIARDVTERQRAEARLREREEQYRAIFDGSADPMVLWNEELEVADVNVAFVRMKGIAREEIVGRLWSARPDAADMPTLLPHIRAALEGRESQLVQRVSHANGGTMDMELRYLPVRIGGEPFALGIGRNITERLRLESQLRQAQKMEAIGQLTGGIAHDFNNILTSVLGYVSMARERAEAGTDARLAHQLGQARLAAERARDLVAQMLAFARRKGGARQPLALQRLVHESLGMLRATLPSSVLLQVEPTSDRLPDIEADAVQIGQVLMNLVINARDAVSGAGQVRVSLRAASAGGWRCRSCGEQVMRGHWVELAVADDGCGIAPATLQRMFDPFFSTKPTGQGTGMGLAMVHGIVHDHRGHIGVDTESGRGSTFRILLPAVAALAASAAERPGEADASSTQPAAVPLLQGRVLVVEDDALAGDFLREQLETWGLDVVLQRDARDAMAWLARPDERLDLLLTDLTMPHFSGLHLARHATRLRPGLPVLLMSGDLAAADAESRRAAGVSHTLGKPLDVAALRQVLVQIVQPG